MQKNNHNLLKVAANLKTDAKFLENTERYIYQMEKKVCRCSELLKRLLKDYYGQVIFKPYICEELLRTGFHVSDLVQLFPEDEDKIGQTIINMKNGLNSKEYDFGTIIVLTDYIKPGEEVYLLNENTLYITKCEIVNVVRRTSGPAMYDKGLFNDEELIYDFQAEIINNEDSYHMFLKKKIIGANL